MIRREIVPPISSLLTLSAKPCEVAPVAKCYSILPYQTQSAELVDAWSTAAVLISLAPMARTAPAALDALIERCLGDPTTAVREISFVHAALRSQGALAAVARVSGAQAGVGLGVGMTASAHAAHAAQASASVAIETRASRVLKRWHAAVLTLAATRAEARSGVSVPEATAHAARAAVVDAGVNRVM